MKVKLKRLPQEYYEPTAWYTDGYNWALGENKLWGNHIKFLFRVKELKTRMSNVHVAKVMNMEDTELFLNIPLFI